MDSMMAAARRRFPAGIVPLLLLALAGAGCSEAPAECDDDDLGYLKFTLPIQGTEDIFATRTLTLESVERLPAVAPPQVEYRFRTEPGERFDVRFDDIGYLLPIQTGSTYTVQFEDYDWPGTLLRGYSMVLWDEAGEVVAMLVSDWLPHEIVLRGDLPNDPTKFPPGPDYPIPGLDVVFGEAGCNPRILDTREVRDITNYQLTFSVDGQAVSLWHGQRAALGDFEVEVFRSHKITAKEAEAVTPQISYVIESRAAAALPRAD